MNLITEFLRRAPSALESTSRPAIKGFGLLPRLLEPSLKWPEIRAYADIHKGSDFHRVYLSR